MHLHWSRNTILYNTYIQTCTTQSPDINHIRTGLWMCKTDLFCLQLVNLQSTISLPLAWSLWERVSVCFTASYCEVHSLSWDTLSNTSQVPKGLTTCRALGCGLELTTVCSSRHSFPGNGGTLCSRVQAVGDIVRRQGIRYRLPWVGPYLTLAS